jgi:predicted DNA-binding protein
MNTKPNELSNADILASIVRGSGKYGQAGGSIQRSHRFPVEMFARIENLADMGGVSVSLIINQLLACGIEAVEAKLPPEKVAQLNRLRPEQLDRPIVPYQDDASPGKNPGVKTKAAKSAKK